MPSHTISAIFDVRSDAETAISKLLTVGVQSIDIRIVPEKMPKSTAKTFWEAVCDIFSSAEETDTYAEGVRRGGTLVTVRLNDDLLDAVAHILNEHGSINLDEREAVWRSEGWTSSFGLGAAGMVPGIDEGGESLGIGRAGLGATLAGQGIGPAEIGSDIAVAEKSVTRHFDTFDPLMKRGNARVHVYRTQTDAEGVTRLLP